MTGLIIKGKKDWTLEQVGVNLIFDSHEIPILAQNPVANHNEEIYYSAIQSEIHDTYGSITDSDGNLSRQIIYTGRECITTIQMLMNRDNGNTMLVYMRSSNANILSSDIGFLCRLALTYNIDRVKILIGSLHVILK